MAIRIALFEAPVQEAQEWVREVMDRLGFSDPHYALHGLGAVLHALRDELSVNQNAAIAAQMPALLRGIYFQDWKPLAAEPKHSSRAAFLRRVDDEFASYETPPDPAQLTGQVLEMLAYRISGECRKVRRTLSSDLRALWPMTDEELDEQ
jgi:uncharacterized protein (DUF2267 family)